MIFQLQFLRLLNNVGKHIFKLFVLFLTYIINISCVPIERSNIKLEDYIWQYNDSLEKVSQKANIESEIIRRHNKIYNEEDVAVGSIIYIPIEGDKNKNKSNLYSNLEKSKLFFKNLYTAESQQLTEVKTTIWPVEGRVSSGYGLRWGRLHQGIDIVAEYGTPIKAADAGKVIKAGFYNGYGLLVEIRHNQEFSTLYAHASRINVNVGEYIGKGEVIGGIGESGNSNGVHLHFEVRKNGKPIDPVLYLPNESTFFVKNN